VKSFIEAIERQILIKNNNVSSILSISILVFYVSLVFNKFCAYLLPTNEYGFEANLYSLPYSIVGYLTLNSFQILKLILQ